MKQAKFRSDSSEQRASCAPKQEEKLNNRSSNRLSDLSGEALAGSREWRSRLQFDECDRALIEQFRWYRNGTSTRSQYAFARPDGKRKVFMHHMIIGVHHGAHVDHINGDIFDNRRENLRVVSVSRNVQNQHRPRGVSRFQGVSFAKRGRGQWFAKIECHRVQYGLGHYATEEAAAAVYDAAALILFGPEAKQNLPSHSETDHAEALKRIERYQTRKAARG